MKDLHIRDSADLAQLPPGFRVETWDIGRSTIGPVSIYTSWLPCAGHYETLATGPSAWLEALGWPCQWRTHTREAARDAHAQVVRACQRLLDADEALVYTQHHPPVEDK